MTEKNKAREARELAKMSASQAAAVVHVKLVTWARWEGQTSRKTEIPFAVLEYFKLKTGTHEEYFLSKKF